jgi:non-canonical (house-cleaning) NTP pyrophosphatase
MTIEEQIQEREQKSAVIGKAVGAMLPPSVGYAVALGSLGRYHMGAEGALIGGLLGYFIGSKTAHDPEARRSIIQEVMSGGARPGNGIGGNADTSSGIMSARELMNYTYQRYGFDGRWGDFVGQPSVNFHAMIFGRPKQGKSILSVQWAKYLSENFGRVLYVASEEGFSVTLQKKVVEFAMDNPRLDFANFRDFTQIREAVNAGNYQFVFIDSVNFIKITPEDVEEIKAENPATAFITIQQATKNGNFRGSQEFAHNCDMVIRVEAGVAHHQGRFQEGTEMAIFDGPEKSSNGAKTETPGANGVESSALGGSEMGYSDGYTNGDQLALF